MSRYENYAIKNNIFWKLAVWIGSLSTSIQLNTGEWARFSVGMLATLENIVQNEVKKREIVLITAIDGDVLTVTRKYEACPWSDTDNTSGKVSYSFSTDDTISAYITKWHFDKINESINDIYDNWVVKLRTDVVSWLQIKVNAWPVWVWSSYYDFDWWTLTLDDNTTSYIMIDEDGNLISSTDGRDDSATKVSIVTTSNWAVTGIQDWRLWTIWWKIGWVNIHDLTEKSYISTNDEFIIADSDNIFQNKKVKYSTIWLDTKFDYTAWEDISAWDVLELTDWITTIWSATEYIEFWNTAQQELSKPVIWSGNVWDNLLIRVWKVYATDDIKVRIETDNNWLPSWTLFNANAEYTISNANISAQQNQFAPVVVENSSLSQLTWYWFWCKFTVETTMYIFWITASTVWWSPDYTVDFKLWTLSGNTYTIINTETSLTKGSSTWLQTNNRYWLLSTPIKLTPWDYVYYFCYKDENNQIVNFTHHYVYRKWHYDVPYLTNMNNVISDVADLWNSWTISLINTDYVWSYERPVFIVPTLTDINIDLSNLTLTENSNYHIVIKRSWTNSDDDKFYLAKTSTWTILDRLKYKDADWWNNSNSYYWVSNSAFFSRAYIKATQINWVIKIATQDVLSGNIVPYASNGKIWLYTNLTALTSYYLDSNNSWKITDTFGDYYVWEALSDNILYIDSTPNVPVYVWDWSKKTFTIKRNWTYRLSCMYWQPWTSTSISSHDLTISLDWVVIASFTWRMANTLYWRMCTFNAKCWSVLTISTASNTTLTQVLIEKIIPEDWYVE